MTLPGGPADKLGNRYEKWWTVRECVRLLHGDADAIRIEVPGVEKTEFVVTVGARRELHQVKRSHPTGKWSLAALGSDGLLRAMGNALAGNDDRFVFVSGSDAPELTNLCEAANDAESVEEFERAYLAAQGRKRSFETLLNRYWWKCGTRAAVDRLRRIKVHTISEHDLEDQVRWGARALFLANPDTVLVELRAIVEYSVHHTMTRQGLVEALDQRGYRIRRQPGPEHAGFAVREATDRYLGGARQRLIGETLVRREASETLLSRLGETATDSAVTGKAGSGKTACVLEITEALRERGLPVLAFRLDRIPFSSVSTTADLGDHLGLEESPVLVLAAAAEAAGRPGVLIVDQLDAVSTMSGRSSGAFDVVESLLQEARGTRARAVIHSVVVCRAFDWRHDHRLRRLVPDPDAQVDVTGFETDEVRKILVAAGFDPVRFRERQLALLRLPQNLSLFLEAGFDPSRAPTFDTATQLFGRYWDEKRRAVEKRISPSPDQWKAVMEALCDEMTSTQQLSAPRETLDDFPTAYVDQLASEGVLTFDGRRCGFGHESFFDYCFARVFIRRRESLASFLKGSEQHLFRRAQVRQVLAYLRDADLARYVQELRTLLPDERIRAHIKDLVFTLLAAITEPNEEEWVLWQQWITPALKAIEEDRPNPDKLSAISWQRFFGAPSWFEMTDRHGVIEDWLTSGNARYANLAVDYLGHHQRHSPDRVAALLEPYADRGGEWALRLRCLMEWADHHTSRPFFDLFLRLVDNGTLDEARGPIAVNTTFWDMLDDLGENRPEWVPEALAHRFRRRLAVVRAGGGDLRTGEFFRYDQSAAVLFNTSAKHAPAVFVKHVLPVVLEISDSALIGDTPPKRDAVWPFLTKEEHPGGEEACLPELAGALAALAREGVTDIRDAIAGLRRRDTHVANHLLLALYAGGAARYADEAAALLCDEPWRFQCGLSDSPHWCAMETIRAVVPHCTPENRDRLETAILCYVHPYERTSEGYKRHGHSRFDLLSAIPSKFRSSHAKAHFEELARKFGEPQGEPRGVTGGIVRSPIEKDAADKMTDDQWLRAIMKYRSEDRWCFSPDEVTGGAWQLAQVLGERAKEEPERFACLGLRFPTDTNSVYLEHILSALREAPIASDLKLQVCRKAFAESRGPSGRSIADVLGKIEDPLPDDAVHMLHQLATEHEDPASEAWQEDAGGGKPYYNGDIHFNGINTTRGRAADAVRDLIFSDTACIERFRSTLDRMIRDRSAAVLSCVAGTLRAVAYHDPALAVSLFLSMNLSADLLLATRHVCGFISDHLRNSFPELRPLVNRMIQSSEPEVCEAGARLAGIAALIHEGAVDVLDEALQGNARRRLGVAQVAAANIAAPEYRAWCETTLAALFDDDDADVRRKAASCFRQLQGEALGTYGNLIATFRDSAAFEEDSSSMLYTLEKSLGRLPGMTCEVCEKFLDRFADEARDIRTGRARDTRTVAKLIFRTYQQHQDDEWTSRSLDLIDRLCLDRIHNAGSELEQFER